MSSWASSGVYREVVLLVGLQVVVAWSLQFNSWIIGWDITKFFFHRILYHLSSVAKWSKDSKTVLEISVGPFLGGAALFLAKKSKGGTLLTKKYFFQLLCTSLVSNRPAWWADSKTVLNVAVWWLETEKKVKMWQKMQKMAKNGQNAIFWHFFANILAYRHSTTIYDTVLESAHPAGRFDTKDTPKSQKKFFL